MHEQICRLHVPMHTCCANAAWTLIALPVIVRLGIIACPRQLPLIGIHITPLGAPRQEPRFDKVLIHSERSYIAAALMQPQLLPVLGGQHRSACSLRLRSQGAQALASRRLAASWHTAPSSLASSSCRHESHVANSASAASFGPLDPQATPAPASSLSSRGIQDASVARTAGEASTSGQEPALPSFTVSKPRFRLPNLTAPISWTYMLSYIAFMLILPISGLLYKASGIPWQIFLARATEPVALHAYYVTFSMAIVAATINCFFGFLLAWILAKYKFPGKKWLDAAVDLPFALPTSVAGLTLATVYGDEFFIGQFLQSVGIQVVFTKLGVAAAMIFVSFPFVVRTMQPVLLEMEKEMEEAAYTLGASNWRTFTDVIFPPLLPSLLTGTALAFSRALGEFGSVVIISSNFAFKDLIAPVLIFQCLEQYDYVGATVVGTVLLCISLCMMLAVNWLQSYTSRFRK